MGKKSCVGQCAQDFPPDMKRRQWGLLGSWRCWWRRTSTASCFPGRGLICNSGWAADTVQRSLSLSRGRKRVWWEGNSKAEDKDRVEVTSPSLCPLFPSPVYHTPVLYFCRLSLLRPPFHILVSTTLSATSRGCGPGRSMKLDFSNPFHLTSVSLVARDLAWNEQEFGDFHRHPCSLTHMQTICRCGIWISFSSPLSHQPPDGLVPEFINNAENTG